MRRATAPRDYRRIGAAVRERDLGANVRVRRRAVAAVPKLHPAVPRGVALADRLGGAGVRRAKPDVIHAHSFFGIGLEALLNGACLGIPVIGTNHTTIAGFGPHIPVSVDRGGAYVMWFYNRCDYVTAPSRSVFDELGTARLCRPHRRRLQSDRHRPVHARRAPKNATALRARFGLRGPTITYAGRLGAGEEHRGAAARDGDAA